MKLVVYMIILYIKSSLFKNLSSQMRVRVIVLGQTWGHNQLSGKHEKGNNLSQLSVQNGI